MWIPEGPTEVRGIKGLVVVLGTQVGALGDGNAGLDVNDRADKGLLQLVDGEDRAPAPDRLKQVPGKQGKDKEGLGGHVDSPAAKQCLTWNVVHLTSTDHRRAKANS